MPRAKLQVTLPPSVWVADLSSSFPDVTFRVLAAFPQEDRGVGLVELTGAEASAVLAEMREYPVVNSVRRLGGSAETELVEFETVEPPLLFSAQESGVPLEPPVEVRDGVATVEVTASRDRLSKFGEQLEAFGMHFDVAYVRPSVEAESLLTERQQEVVEAAIQRGYYDTPRTSSLTELADDLGMAKSTVSETLHRAEETIVKQYAADSLSPEELAETE